MDVAINCVCPPSGGQRPHESDIVTLRDRLDFRRAAAIKGDIVVMKLDHPDGTAGETLAVLSEGYIRQGIESWTLVADGKPLPVTQEAIEALILADLDTAFTIADAADDLYAEAVMRPLLGLGSPSSPATPTESSTSPEPSPSVAKVARSTSPTLLRTPSKRSSTSTSRTDDTGTTTEPPAGDSSSSQSSTSAA